MDLGTILDLADHGPDVYVGIGPQYPWGGLYGGQIVAQPGNGGCLAFHFAFSRTPQKNPPRILDLACNTGARGFERKGGVGSAFELRFSQQYAPGDRPFKTRLETTIVVQQYQRDTRVCQPVHQGR